MALRRWRRKSGQLEVPISREETRFMTSQANMLKKTRLNIPNRPKERQDSRAFRPEMPGSQPEQVSSKVEMFVGVGARV